MDNKEIPTNIVIEAMNKEQERTIFSAIRAGDEKLKMRLLQKGMAIAAEIANECQCNEVNFDELFPEAVLAVQESIANFDYLAQESFSNYLKCRIEERMQKCYANLAWMLPIDYRIMQLHDKYEIALLELYPECSNADDISVQDEAYVADYLKVSIDELRNMKNEYSMCRVESLNSPIILNEPIKDDIDNTVDLIETIVDPKTDNPAAEYLDNLMDCLSEEERYVICAREGVLSVEELTDEQIASNLRISVERIENIYNCAVERIRQVAEKKISKNQTCHQ